MNEATTRSLVGTVAGRESDSGNQGLRGVLGAAAWRRLIVRARRWQQRRAMYRALSELNGHMLRDLGIDRSEITSVCAEIAGDAEPTRMHTLRARAGEPS